MRTYNRLSSPAEAAQGVRCVCRAADWFPSAAAHIGAQDGEILSRFTRSRAASCILGLHVVASPPPPITLAGLRVAPQRTQRQHLRREAESLVGAFRPSNTERCGQLMGCNRGHPHALPCGASRHSSAVTNIRWQSKKANRLTLPDATPTGSSRCLVHHRHRMETRNCVERVQDEGITKQGRDDRRRSLQECSCSLRPPLVPVQ
jgi:hypothetical protein